MASRPASSVLAAGYLTGSGMLERAGVLVVRHAGGGLSFGPQGGLMMGMGRCFGRFDDLVNGMMCRPAMAMDVGEVNDFRGVRRADQ